MRLVKNCTPIVFFILVLIGQAALANEFYVSYVIPETKSTLDSFTVEQLKKIQGQYRNEEQLRLYINEALLGTGLRNISYELSGGALHMKFDLLIRVESVLLKSDLPEGINLNPYLLKKGEYLDIDSIDNSVDSLRGYLRQKGFYQPRIHVSRKSQGLIYEIDVGDSQTLKKVIINNGDSFLLKRYQELFNDYIDKPIDLLEIIRVKELLDIEMREYGYLSLNSKLGINAKHELVIDLKYLGPYLFHFSGNKHFSYYYLKKVMRNQFRVVDEENSETLVLNIIEASYKEAGFYQTKIDVDKQIYSENKLGQVIRRFDIHINEGHRKRFDQVLFKGNQSLSTKQLKRFYGNNASSLLRGKYIDENGAEQLVSNFKKLYIKNGYLSLSSRVKIPYDVDENRTGQEVSNIDFIFNEGNQTIVSDLVIVDINENKLNGKYIERLTVKYLDRPMNPFQIEQEIELLEKEMKSRGYLNARVVNENQSSLVTYSKDRSLAKIKFIVEKGQRYKLGEVYVFGNFKTKDKLVLKHVNSVGYQYITPDNLGEFKKNLFALGLFQSVRIEVKPKSIDSLTEGDDLVADLIIRVKERDYGKVEIVPGIRSDTGAKIGFNLGYSNIGGMGRSLRWSSQISQRLTYSVFDPIRKAQDNKFLEYAFNLSFTEIDFLKKDINYLAQLGTRHRRFFAFDARVSRFANTLRYNLPGLKLSTSLGHQYEAIKQENGSSRSDNGEFKIGSLIPKFSYDWRDSLANPRSGGLHQLDIEWADKLWLSQDVNGTSVNFTKYVLRNRFYIPFKRGTLALGWTAGVQKNAASSSIPGIKIFRLTGIDQVRGFSDDEINRLPSGSDISQANLQSNAYLNSLKVEPRFFIGENLMLGAFWDAGRVTLNRSRFFDLKQSVGLSLRILTPVGSINLDYGQKLSPEKFADGSIESSGRFHLSIGLF